MTEFIDILSKARLVCETQRDRYKAQGQALTAERFGGKAEAYAATVRLLEAGITSNMEGQGQ